MTHFAAMPRPLAAKQLAMGKPHALHDRIWKRLEEDLDEDAQ